MTKPPSHRAGTATLDDRGQTVQDFAVGIGVFILAVAFVFAFVPTIITPFADSVGPESAQSERIAATIVHNLSDGDPNDLSGSDFMSNYGPYESEDLDDVLGLRVANGNPIDRVNITIVELGSNSDPVEYDGSDMTAGSTYAGEPGASTTRIVTVHGPGSVSGCDPACKLVVRVW